MSIYIVDITEHCRYRIKVEASNLRDAYEKGEAILMSGGREDPAKAKLECAEFISHEHINRADFSFRDASDAYGFPFKKED